MPRFGTRALVLVALVATVAIAAAALSRASAEPPRLDPSPEPATRLDRPSSGRLLREEEVRAQLPAEWRGARLVLVRYAELADLPQPAGIVHPDRLVWLAVNADRAMVGREFVDWELRVYDAASGIRLIALAGTGTPPR